MSVQPILTFIVPVRHPSNAPNWGRLRHRLKQTLTSISRQLDSRWHCIVVANHGAEIGEIPDQTKIVRVDFKPNELHNFGSADRNLVLESFRIDKGKRVLQGIKTADSKYYMIVDDDDFVSRKLVQFISEHPSAPGWRITSGYAWQEGGKFTFFLDKFDEICGSCHIITSEAYNIPQLETNPLLCAEMLGSHKRNIEQLRDKGILIPALPFAGAIYRYGHRDAHSGTKNILTNLVLTKANLKNPNRLLSAIANIRPITRTTVEEFGLPIKI